MGRNAAGLVRQEFTLDLVTARYAALYAELLAGQVIQRALPGRGMSQGAVQGSGPC